MNIGPLSIGNDLAGAILIVGAVLVLALAGLIDGNTALLAILGVAGAIGVYRGRDRVRGGGSGGND